MRELPWLWGESASAARLTGGDLLHRLPPAALASGALLPVLFVAFVTLPVRPSPRLPGAAFASTVLALYAAPVALGREPWSAGGAWSARTVGVLAEAGGFDTPGPLVRWAPLVLQILCLAPLWRLLARTGGRLPWPVRWGVLYLAAVGGWVWQRELAPAAPLLLLLLVLAVPLLPSPRPPAGRRPTHRSTHHHAPTDMSRH